MTAVRAIKRLSRYWLAACVSFAAEPVLAKPEVKPGIVLLHGKNGLPGSLLELAESLERSDVKVDTPEMPWSRNRIYAKSYVDSFGEIDAGLRRLRSRGATTYFVGGKSLGANVAVGYAARRNGVSGVVLLAPGHVPGLKGFAVKVTTDVAIARRLISSGAADRQWSFGDINQGETRLVSTTSRIYLSWFAPDGPAVWARNVAMLKPSMPVFCADGSREFRPRCSYVMSLVPRNAKNRQIRVVASHRGVALVARLQLTIWLDQISGR